MESPQALETVPRPFGDALSKIAVGDDLFDTRQHPLA